MIFIFLAAATWTVSCSVRCAPEQWVVICWSRTSLAIGERNALFYTFETRLLMKKFWKGFYCCTQYTGFGISCHFDENKLNVNFTKAIILSGVLCDTKVYNCDKILLTNSCGVQLFDRQLLVFSLQHQRIHLYYVNLHLFLCFILVF